MKVGELLDIQISAEHIEKQSKKIQRLVERRLRESGPINRDDWNAQLKSALSEMKSLYEKILSVELD